jgi:hypothetical protein
MSKITRSITSTVFVAVLLLGAGTLPTEARAAGLTTDQIGAIISLLQAFGADQSTINSVQVALGGSPSSTLSCGNFANLSYGDFDNNPGGRVSQLQTFLGISSNTFGFGTYGRKTQVAWNARCGATQTTPTATYTAPTNTQTTPNTTTNTAPSTSYVAPTSISVTYPQAGYSLDNSGAKDSGQIATIQWNEQNGDYPVNIWLTNQNGQIIKLLANQIADTGSYVWLYDSTLPTGTYQIQIDVAYPSGKSGQNTAYSGYFTLQNNSPKITVTYPNGGEQLAAGLGKDVDFRITWTSINLSGTAYVYLDAADGNTCLLGTAPVSQGNFPLLYGHYNCQNTSSVLTSGQYKVSIETDTNLSSGKSVNDQGDGYFTLSVTQPAPSISYISPTISSGKDVDLVDVYGSNFATQGKGNSPYVDVLQNGVSKLRLSSTDSPMTLLMGVYATPQDTNGSHLQLRINNAALSSGIYQVRITNDAGASNTANYTVQ